MYKKLKTFAFTLVITHFHYKMSGPYNILKRIILKVAQKSQGSKPRGKEVGIGAGHHLLDLHVAIV
jgi:hypothetical protein